MAGAFQGNAFQNNAFQTSGLASTLSLQLPINCVLADQQYYKTRIDVYDIGPANIRQRTRASGSQLGRLSGDVPSFTTTTNNRGYD